MGAYYDEIEIEDMAWDDEKGVFHYPCPCGDRFEISRKQLANYEDVATCPSCSLIIRVIYDPVRGSSVFAFVKPQILIAAARLSWTLRTNPQTMMRVSPRVRKSGMMTLPIVMRTALSKMRWRT
jgi:diphthamide biosynthesis protein 3